jgi:hypothetical protein
MFSSFTATGALAAAADWAVPIVPVLLIVAGLAVFLKLASYVLSKLGGGGSRRKARKKR